MIFRKSHRRARKAASLFKIQTHGMKFLCPTWALMINSYIFVTTVTLKWGGGWSGGAMVLGKLPVPGRPTILITVWQGPIALAVGAGGGGLDIFTLIYPFSSFSLSLGDGPI